eukprot:1311485-Amphidinium_carterae.1
MQTNKNKNRASFTVAKAVEKAKTQEIPQKRVRTMVLCDWDAHLTFRVSASAPASATITIQECPQTANP